MRCADPDRRARPARSASRAFPPDEATCRQGSMRAMVCPFVLARRSLPRLVSHVQVRSRSLPRVHFFSAGRRQGSVDAASQLVARACARAPRHAHNVQHGRARPWTSLLGILLRAASDIKIRAGVTRPRPSGPGPRPPVPGPRPPAQGQRPGSRARAAGPGARRRAGRAGEAGPATGQRAGKAAREVFSIALSCFPPTRLRGCCRRIPRRIFGVTNSVRGCYKQAFRIVTNSASVCYKQRLGLLLTGPGVGKLKENWDPPPRQALLLTALGVVTNSVWGCYT